MDEPLILEYKYLQKAITNIKSLKLSVEKWGIRTNLEKMQIYLERLQFVYVTQKAEKERKLEMPTLEDFND